MNIEEFLDEYKGYSADFYECVKEKSKFMSKIASVMLCEKLYG
jgi:hypothetical protein